jgi:dipeptidyl aminopeptidase/acylaminoacyl peptidase
MPTESNVSFSAGNLLFAKEGTLLAQRFDPKSLRLSREARPVAQRCSGYSLLWAYQNFSASADGVLVYREARPRLSQMVWFDRDGRRLGSVGEPAVYGEPRVSPDGQRIAVTVRDPDRRRADVWIFDPKRGVNARLTSGEPDSQSPVWSPDGNRIAFGSARKHQADLYVKSMTGAGSEEPLIEAEGQRFPTDWSADGRYIAFEDREPRGERRVSVSLLPLFGDRKPVIFFRRGTDFGTERFSPDGRWLAFTAADSGRSEIYVAPISGPGSRAQVSNAGGASPRWSRSGKELFYLAPDGKVMGVEFQSAKDAGSFDVGTPKPLFETDLTERAVFPSFPSFDVSPDGRFLVVTRIPGAAPPPITLVVNWPVEVKR